MPLCARDVMEDHVLTVSPRMSLPELVDFLISHRITGAPVVDRGKVVGIVSRSDLVRVVSLERSLAGVEAEGVGQQEFSPGEIPDPVLEAGALAGLPAKKVREIMVPDPIAVAPDVPVAEVAKLMVDRHMHRVLVTEGAKLCGVISSLDLVGLLADGRARET